MMPAPPADTDNSTEKPYHSGHGDRVMAANIEDKVIEKLRVLPEAQQAEVLKFVEDLVGVETKADNGHPHGRALFRQRGETGRGASLLSLWSDGDSPRNYWH